MVSRTSARPSGPFVAVPAKMTSSILPPRRVFAPCSPMTQASASTTLLLPEPFGPTTQLTPCSNANVVLVAKDLKPLSVRLLRYTTLLFSLRQRVALRYPNHAHWSDEQRRDSRAADTDRGGRRRLARIRGGPRPSLRERRADFRNDRDGLRGGGGAAGLPRPGTPA